MGHAERSHALLGPSGAHRWMECPPSARLEEQFPDSTSEAAREGTLAHELAEIKSQTLLLYTRLWKTEVHYKAEQIEERRSLAG